MYKKNIYIILFILLTCCTNSVNMRNEQKGQLTASYQLVVGNEKKILLDDDTAPNPPYMQMIRGKNEEQILTFFNPHKNAIYFYDYENSVCTRTIEYEQQGPNAVFRLAGYFIKNMDSIYVYNRSLVELVLTDSLGHVKQRISLRDNNKNDWYNFYPQYEFSTINPMSENKGQLILTGMSPYGTDSLYHKFKFTSCIDLKSGNVKFMHTYPLKLYGFNAFQWQDPLFMQVYRELLPNGEFIYSFPVSHDIYITSFDANNFKTVYAGSNVAGSIRSMYDYKGKIPGEIIVEHYIKYDFYTGIIYDSYRKVYYRFMMQAIPGATPNTHWKEKPVIVIIMDEQFNYMGETVIGTGEEWNWKNSFITPEGLVIEYIDLSVDSGEEYLILKTLTVEKINK